MLGAPTTRMALERLQPRFLLAAALTATAAGFFVLVTTPGLAFPVAVTIGMFGSMSRTIPLTMVQRGT
jgi:hypothetical protein